MYNGLKKLGQKYFLECLYQPDLIVLMVFFRYKHSKKYFCPDFSVISFHPHIESIVCDESMRRKYFLECLYQPFLWI